jgi:hypothetical protein
MFTLRIWVFKPGILKHALKKRSTSHLPPGEETPNVWTSGRRKGKQMVTI